MNYYLSVLKNYATFSGRAQRAEYWYFILFNFLVSIVVGILDGVLGTMEPNTGVGLLGLVYILAIIVPSIAVLVRRLHDVGKSGWYFWVALIPLIGALYLLFLTVQDSARGKNQYGPNPKGINDNL